jgi:crossover junction endodeoxyribonuclease RuvC
MQSSLYKYLAVDKSVCYQDNHSPYQVIEGFPYLCLLFCHPLILKKLSLERIILGIDPGTVIMGYGVIMIRDKKIELMTMGVLKLHQFSEHEDKLKRIFERTISLIEEYHPDELAIEAPFYGKNVQSMLKLGRAQGVAMAAALSRTVPIFEYSPRKIKQSITGRGSASKEQVALMLQNLLKFTQSPQYLDATDGLAAAVCHYFQNNPGKQEKKFTGWKSFLSENPDRAVG